MSNILKRSIARAKRELSRVTRKVEREERLKAQKDELRNLEAKIKKEKGTERRTPQPGG